MKLVTSVIRKTDRTVSLVPNLSPKNESDKKPVAFYIRGKYFHARIAKNLYNRNNPSLPPSLPKELKERILQEDFPNGDIPCFIIDRGRDIEIIVE